MKAMILAAGFGSRLKPITDNIPKALVTVDGKTLLEHTISRLKKARFDHIIINIHHLGQQIIDFLASNNNFGMKIDISDESDYLVDTGGAIKHAISFLKGNEPFLVHNVDIFSNTDLKTLYKYHLNSNALATLLVSQRQSSRQLLFNNNGHLCGWKNRDIDVVKSLYPNFDPSKHFEYAFSGIHVISTEIFQWMGNWTNKFSIIDLYLSIAPKRLIQAYTEDHLEIVDAGNLDSLKEVHLWLKKHHA